MEEYARMEQKIVRFSEKAMFFSFLAFIFFLPISIALVEIFTTLALIFYIVKRAIIFYGNIINKTINLNVLSPFKKCLAVLRAFKPINNCLNWPIAIFILVNLISVFVSHYPGESWKAFFGKVMQGTFIYFTFIECMNLRKYLRIFLTIFFISYALICVNGLFQYYTGQGFIHGHVMDGGRIFSSLREANDFGTYLVMSLPVLLCLSALMGRKQNERVAKGISSFVFLYSGVIKFSIFMFFLAGVACLGLTFSRGAWLSFGVCLFFIGIKNPKIIFLCLVIVLVFFLVFFYFLSGTRPELLDIEANFINNNRILFWEGAWKIVKDYPLFGSGLNTFTRMANDYDLEWKGWYVHNCYLQMATETGFVGLGAFLWIFIVLFRKMFRFYCLVKDQSQRILLSGFLTGLFGFLFHSFWDTALYSVQLSALMWIVIGIIVAIQKNETEDVRAYK